MRSMLLALLVAISTAPALAAEPQAAAVAPPQQRPSREPILPPAPTLPAAAEIVRFKAPEARQGVAVSATHFYAVVNSAIGKYDRRTGAKVAEWRDPTRVIEHLNSCAVVAEELVCANSNFPDVPMASSIEVFDAATLAHKRSEAIGPALGSLTWLVRYEGAWWATYAHYDATGGEPGRDHRYTAFARLDDDFRPVRTWLFPKTALERMKPTSSSGGVWGDDGLLYVTGHDAQELYVLRLPRWGVRLEHVATIPAPMHGQAIAWDPVEPRTVWGIDRPRGEVMAVRLPKVDVAR